MESIFSAIRLNIIDDYIYFCHKYSLCDLLLLCDNYEVTGFDDIFLTASWPVVWIVDSLPYTLVLSVIQ